MTVKKGESSARTDRTDLIRASWLLHDVNREKVNQAEVLTILLQGGMVLKQNHCFVEGCCK